MFIFAKDHKGIWHIRTNQPTGKIRDQTIAPTWKPREILAFVDHFREAMSCQ